jgi:hypothetical protein
LTDAKGGEFQRERFRQTENTSFGGRVGGAVLTAAERDVRGDVDDRACLLILHYPDDGTTAEKGRREIRVDNGLPVLEREFLELMSMHTAAGNVNENINAAVTDGDLIKSSLHLTFLGQVGAMK